MGEALEAATWRGIPLMAAAMAADDRGTPALPLLDEWSNEDEPLVESWGTGRVPPEIVLDITSKTGYRSCMHEQQAGGGVDGWTQAEGM